MLPFTNATPQLLAGGGLFLQGVPPLGLYDWRQRGMVLTPMVAWIHLGVVQICSPDARVQWVLTFFVVVAWPSHPSGYYLGQRRH